MFFVDGLEYVIETMVDNNNYYAEFGSHNYINNKTNNRKKIKKLKNFNSHLSLMQLLDYKNIKRFSRMCIKPL